MVQPRMLDWLPEHGITWEVLVKTPDELKWQWTILAEYSVGFIVIGLVSALTLVGMFLAACIVPACRCCCCCGGGKRRPRDHERDADRSCYRNCCGVSLFIVLCACVLGVAAMFVLSEELFEQLSGNDSGFDQISRGLEELPPFARETMYDVNKTVYAGAVETNARVFEELEKLPEDAMKKLDEQSDITSTLATLMSQSTKLVVMETQLENAKSLSADLQTTTTALAPQLSTSRDNIIAALGTCGTACDDVRRDVNTLGMGLASDVINKNVTTLHTTVSDVLSDGFTHQVDQLVSAVNDAGNDVRGQMNDAIADARRSIETGIDDKVLHNVNEINRRLKKIDISVATEAMDEVKDIITRTYAHYSVYGGFMFFALIVLLIVILLFTGLCHGCCSPRTTTDKNCCKVDRSTGSCWLFSGIFFIFCFYWMLTAIAMTLFLGGGVSHTEACRYFVHKDSNTEQLKAPRQTIVDFAQNVCGYFDDCPEIITDLNGTYFEAVDSCRHNEPIYKALKLAENGFDIHDLLDMKYVNDVMETLAKEATPTLPTVDLLPDELDSQLTTLDTLFTTYKLSYLLTELSKNVTIPADLNKLADDLELIKNQPGVVKGDLENEIATLRSLYPTSRAGETTKAELYDLILAINENLGDPAIFGVLKHDLVEAEHVINTQGELLIESVVREKVVQETEVYYLFIEGAVSSVETEIGKCYPLFHGTSTVINAGCVSFLYPINAMAFSLGWLMFFLFLALIFSFKLADHYRRLVKSRYTTDDNQPLLPPLITTPPRGNKYDLTQINPACCDNPPVDGRCSPLEGAISQTRGDVFNVTLDNMTPADYPPPEYSAALAGDEVVLIYPDLTEAEPLPEKK